MPPKPKTKNESQTDRYNRLQRNIMMRFDCLLNFLLICLIALKKYDSAKVVDDLLQKYVNNPANSKTDLSALISQRLMKREQPRIPFQSRVEVNSAVTERPSFNQKEQIESVSMIPEKPEMEYNSHLSHNSVSAVSPLRMQDENETKRQRNSIQQHNFSFSRGSSKTTETKSRNSYNTDNSARNKENRRTYGSRDGSPESKQGRNTKRETPVTTYKEVFEIKENDESNVIYRF